MEPAAAAVIRAGSLVRVRVACGARARRPVVGGICPAGPGRRRVLVAALPEPLEPLSLAPEGAAALPPEADDVHGDVVDSAETSSPPAVLGRVVRVRFVLNWQCPFGESIHLVGDDAALGLWDPLEAIALDWSEGHDWTVEKDLPANRLVEFKFLLQDSTGKFLWQDGPNRSLHTGETTNTLVVKEDWGDVSKQKIVEEAENQGIKEDGSSLGEGDGKSTVGANASVQVESMNVHEASQPELVLDERKIQDELDDKIETAPQNGSVATCSDDDYAKRTGDGVILPEVISPEDGVLVNSRWTGASEHELFWGWKALQQLLISLGFKKDTT